MTNTGTTFASLISIGLTVLLPPVPSASAQEPGSSQASAARTDGQTQPDLEKQRKDAEQQARRSLDQEAVAAIEETRKAAKAISEEKTDEALAAIERAIGKINIVVARNPSNAIIPVGADAEIIETAPLDVKAIKAIAAAAEEAVADKDYPAARVLLHALTSEIRVRTYHLPLATYPSALSDAVRLLDKKKTKEARAVLQLALNTLVVIDRVTPLPLALAQAAIEDAQALREKDKDAAMRLLASARHELDRARELGYAGKDPEYAALSSSLAEVEKQLKGNEDTGSVFSKLRERVAAFFKRQSQSEKSSET